ncbi:Ras protein-specific guanine nucleotide-releasing factor [Branchiostoma belcheri]|nr:Ras protein-specific guanine nucleotide-releasing factor [Branchiostoma belcheri]
MQKAIRFSEGQLLSLSACARADATLAGFLYKRSSDTGKWQQRWFALYQNFLFYFENDTAMRPSGLALIEGCQCERVISTKGKDSEKQPLRDVMAECAFVPAGRLSANDTGGRIDRRT